MLVLTRKLNERIIIGDDITVTVVEIRDGTVRLGIEAPRSIAVHREEVAMEIRDAKRRDAEHIGGDW